MCCEINDHTPSWRSLGRVENDLIEFMVGKWILVWDDLGGALGGPLPS